MNENILIKFRRSDEYILIHTYDRRHGRSHTFYMNANEFAKWLNGGYGYFHDRDCYDYLTIHPDTAHTFYCTMVWLSEYSNGDMHGYTQKFQIPQNVLLSVIRGEYNETAYLVRKDEKPKVSFDISRSAHRNIAGMPTQIRRAFSKFMRDHFRYTTPSTVEIFADGNADFYFRDLCASGFNMNGGIILSTVDQRYRNGTAFAHRYSMHT